MATFDFIQQAFIAGELNPILFGRSDLEKYDIGLALCRNFFVDYRGGISSRPGTHFVDFVKADDKDTKFFEFTFSPTDTLVLLFGDSYLRFISNDSYILEPDKTITNVTQANPAVVTSTAHGYSTGDWIKIANVAGMTELNSRTLVVGTTTTNTFELEDVFGNNIDSTSYTAYSSGGVANRIYEVTSPYPATALSELRAEQNRNLVRLTHPDYARRDLVRTNNTSWAISESTTGTGIDAPGTITFTGSGTGFKAVYVITAVNSAGEESISGTPQLSTEYSDGGSKPMTWANVAGATSYNIYRSSEVPTTLANLSFPVGYLSTSFGSLFTDRFDIIPDFAITPPIGIDPFADGAIEFIEITAFGTGYPEDATTVSVSGGGGSGFVGVVVINNTIGQIINVRILDGGSGYSAPVTVTFTGSGGSGATATATVGATSGNNPRVSTIFQQRQIYAGSDNQPLTIWGSKPRLFDNHDIARVVVENDSYEYDVDARQASPILHLEPFEDRLVAMSENGVWQLTGGTDAAITPLNAKADVQPVPGANGVPPLRLEESLMYMSSKGTRVIQIALNSTGRLFVPKDVSIISSHFFTPTKQITHWTYAREPYRIVWAVRSDGAMLSNTIVPEENVFAWAQHWTKGLFKDVVSVQEGNLDSVYVMVSRYVNGRWTKIIERLDSRTFDYVEDAWCVDAGLELTNTKPAATLTAAAPTGSDITVTSSAAVFASGDVDKIIRAGGGKAIVTEYTDTTNVKVRWLRDMTEVIPEDDSNTPLTIASGEWTMDAPTTSVGGLWHLEGESITGLADGNVVKPMTVSNGSVTLDAAATRIILGLHYTPKATTLPITAPPEVLEGRRKRIVGLVARMHDSRGLKYGTDLSKLYEFKERTTELPGEPVTPVRGPKNVHVGMAFKLEAQTYFVQDYPLPATLLGAILEAEIGDDRD